MHVLLLLLSLVARAELDVTNGTLNGTKYVTIFHWNAHHQCAQDNESCRRAAVAKFGELVSTSGASIAVGIEIRGASSALRGWSSSGEYQDAVSVMVAPGWRVLKRGGGQIVSGWGARGVAVMLVQPPFSVAGCSKLCVLGVHPGHDPITGGKGIVNGVCGSSVASRCSIASGDWNTGASNVRGGSWSSWNKLIGGRPTVLAPDSKTCCHPSTCCNYDHGGTNIQGASQGATHVWPYQLTNQFSMKEEHMPVSVQMRLPTGSNPGPSPPTPTPPSPKPGNASCKAHRACANLWGDCCPTPSGMTLDCCRQGEEEEIEEKLAPTKSHVA